MTGEQKVWAVTIVAIAAVLIAIAAFESSPQEACLKAGNPPAQCKELAP